MDSGCGPGLDVSPGEVEESFREALREIQARAERASATVKYRIEDDGRVVVALASGSRHLVPGTIGTHRVF